MDRVVIVAIICISVMSICIDISGGGNPKPGEIVKINPDSSIDDDFYIVLGIVIFIILIFIATWLGVAE